MRIRFVVTVLLVSAQGLFSQPASAPPPMAWLTDPDGCGWLRVDGMPGAARATRIATSETCVTAPAYAASANVFAAIADGRPVLADPRTPGIIVDWLPGFDAGASRVAISPDGKTIAAWYPEPSRIAWGAGGGPVHSFSPTSAPTAGVDFRISGNGAVLTVLRGETSTEIWILASDGSATPLLRAAEPLTADWIAARDVLVAASSGKIHVGHDVETSPRWDSFELGEPVWAAATLPLGWVALIAGESRQLAAIHLPTRELRRLSSPVELDTFVSLPEGNLSLGRDPNGTHWLLGAAPEPGVFFVPGPASAAVEAAQ